MVSFLNAKRSKTLLSQGLYIGLNVLMALLVLVLVLVTNSPVPSCILVLLGKWRIFAVRPRYWLMNLKANLVDIIVGLSVAFCIYLISDSYIVAQAILAALYAVWLVFVKPSSKPAMVSIQAGAALILSTTVVASMCYSYPPIVVVLLSALIGYAAVRHILVTNLNDENSPELVSFAAGLVMAELSWAAYHWLVAYSVPGTSLKVPQFTIIAALLGYVAIMIYKAHYDEDGAKIHPGDIIPPVVFAIAVIIVMLVAFSGASINLS
ncbi:MAG: hypothetical protein LBL84_02265 [Candidatus Nomurabacteria bacterium]|nr:hypothetical protein [Candidatus Nomurabacteria bacterium]